MDHTELIRVFAVARYQPGPHVLCSTGHFLRTTSSEQLYSLLTQYFAEHWEVAIVVLAREHPRPMHAVAMRGRQNVKPLMWLLQQRTGRVWNRFPMPGYTGLCAVSSLSCTSVPDTLIDALRKTLCFRVDEATEGKLGPLILPA